MVVASPAAPCACRPPSRPNSAAPASDTLGPGRARQQSGRVGAVRLQAALVCRGLRGQQIVAGLVFDASDRGLKLRGGGVELVVRGLVARVGELVVHEYVVTPWSTAAAKTCSHPHTSSPNEKKTALKSSTITGPPKYHP